MPPPICYTKLISGTEMLVLDSMDDDQIIGRARRVFSEYLDPRFIDGLVETSSLPAEPTKASVHKIIRVGKLATFFNSLSPELNILRFSRAQIVQFCEKYRSKISNEGSGTFFLFKQGEGFSVARVADVVGYGKSLVLQVYELSYKGDWGGYENHQIVVQQLEPASP